MSSCTVHDLPRRRRRRLAAGLAILTAILLSITGASLRWRDDPPRPVTGPATGAFAVPLPAVGQTSYQLGDDAPVSSADQRPVPIASLAKVMTAYLVLRDHPLTAGSEGFTMTVTAADVADTERRRDRDESIVDVVVGEQLTERQALMAVLLPSANNVAVMLARRVAGSTEAFVREMNAAARSLGMHDTTYTDPSGFDPGTVSTASDQLVLAEAAAGNSVLAAMMATPSFLIPVAGTIHNTDVLLGSAGFVGMKTGSDTAAGGCFMFHVVRQAAGGRRVDLIGVVLGQQGRELVTAGQYAARRLADHVFSVHAT